MAISIPVDWKEAHGVIEGVINHHERANELFMEELQRLSQKLEQTAEVAESARVHTMQTRREMREIEQETLSKVAIVLKEHSDKIDAKLNEQEGKFDELKGALNDTNRSVNETLNKLPVRHSRRASWRAVEGESDRDHLPVRVLVFTSVAPIPNLAKGLMDGAVEFHLENVNAISDTHQVVGASAPIGGLCLCRQFHQSEQGLHQHAEAGLALQVFVGEAEHEGFQARGEAWNVAPFQMRSQFGEHAAVPFGGKFSQPQNVVGP